MRPGTPSAPVLAVEDLTVVYAADGHSIAAVQGASLALTAGQGIGIVGESGSGKSTLARAMMALLPSRSARIVSGRITIGGRTVDMSDEVAMAGLRGRQLAMVFQDPLSYLNPLMSVRAQIAEAVCLHDRRADEDRRVRELLDLVRLPRRCLDVYPHELSGGMRQRVLIAIAIACRPAVLIADEPTTALDVTTQAEILSLLLNLRREIKMALVLISHDLGVVARLCDRIYVMYGGHLVECGGRESLLRDPLHPYTRGLLHAARAVRGTDGRFTTLQGDAPSRLHVKAGCPFAPRCPEAMSRCGEAMPPAPPAAATGNDFVRCWHYEH